MLIYPLTGCLSCLSHLRGNLLEQELSLCPFHEQNVQSSTWHTIINVNNYLMNAVAWDPQWEPWGRLEEKGEESLAPSKKVLK